MTDCESRSEVIGRVSMVLLKRLRSKLENVRLRDFSLLFQEVEVAAFVGLRHMVDKHLSIPPFVLGLRRDPGRASSFDLLLIHEKVEGSARHIQTNKVSRFDPCQWAADVRLG